MKKKVVIAGGTGFIGRYFEHRFRQLGYEVNIISRQCGDVQWQDDEKIAQVLEHAQLLINLAGKSVDCRYNEKNRREILNSRIDTTRKLGELIQKCEDPPKLWINSSTATIYRHAEDRPMTEEQGEIGSGFSVDVATSWEREFFSFNLPNTRQIALRTAIVLGQDGGVIKPFLNLTRFGLGGRQGNGRQMFSWIHIEDLFQIVLFLESHKQLTGIYNASSPNPVSNAELMKAFRELTQVRIGLPSPVWLLKMGAVIIKTETELILKSRWVIPEKLVKAGYQFMFPTIDMSLRNIFEDK